MAFFDVKNTTYVTRKPSLGATVNVVGFNGN